MMPKDPNILLLGLEESVAAELACALRRNQQEFRSHSCLPLEALDDFGLVFCAADRQRYVNVLAFIRRLRLPLPLIVVSRQPDTSEWLDALEAGAADYCSPPFETVQIRWIVENALKQ